MGRTVKNEEQVKCEYNGSTIYVPPKIFSQVVLRVQYPKKKYIRYKDGPAMYSMSERTFYTLVHNAGAIHKVDKMALVNVETIDKFLEFFKEE